MVCYNIGVYEKYFPWGGGGGGGYSHVFPIWGHSTSQGTIFRVLCLKQGIQFQGCPRKSSPFLPHDHITFC